MSHTVTPGDGVLCPTCGHNRQKIVDPRKVAGGILRRKVCVKCGARFTTMEAIVNAQRGPKMTRDEVKRFLLDVVVQALNELDSGGN